MATNIIEFFGFDPTDRSTAAQYARNQRQCPFIDHPCSKTLSNGEKSGACTLKPTRGSPVICCPIRLYAENYKILHDVATIAFGANIELFPGRAARSRPNDNGRSRVAVFGKRWGGELRLPNRGASGSYFVDWILARLDSRGNVESFVAVEVQSIDTTGNYQAERTAYLAEQPFEGSSTAGFNWENVNKRILPQIIYKGHVLRRERLCRQGLFFVCPKPVYDKIRERLGDNLLGYTLQPGALSILWYDTGNRIADGAPRQLIHGGTFTTTVDQVANAFTSPSNLPPQNVYEDAILRALDVHT